LKLGMHPPTEKTMRSIAKHLPFTPDNLLKKTARTGDLSDLERIIEPFSKTTTRRKKKKKQSWYEEAMEQLDANTDMPDGTREMLKSCYRTLNDLGKIDRMRSMKSLGEMMATGFAQQVVALSEVADSFLLNYVLGSDRVFSAYQKRAIQDLKLLTMQVRSLAAKGDARSELHKILFGEKEHSFQISETDQVQVAEWPAVNFSQYKRIVLYGHRFGGDQISELEKICPGVQFKAYDSETNIWQVKDGIKKGYIVIAMIGNLSHKQTGAALGKARKEGADFIKFRRFTYSSIKDFLETGKQRALRATV